MAISPIAAARQQAGFSPPGRDAAGRADTTEARDIPHRDAAYLLAPSDQISVDFPLTPEFNQIVTLDPGGTVSMAAAKNIPLAGLTTQQAEIAIRDAYASVLKNPIVTVQLKDFRHPYFIVTGQVSKPGKYDLRGSTLATEAVAEAGGFNDQAKHSQVLLFRRISEQEFEVRLLDLKRFLAGHSTSEDPEIQAGDMLYVPQNFISKVRRFIPSSGVGAYYQLHP